MLQLAPTDVAALAVHCGAETVAESDAVQTTARPVVATRTDSGEAGPGADTETKRLFEQAARSSESQRRRLQNRIIELHLGLAENIARKYRGHAQDWRDLYQVACVGLINAVRRFEPERGKDFFSYAVPTISGEVKRYLRDTGWVIRPPRRVQELAVLIDVAQRGLEQSLHRAPTMPELAEAIGSTHEEAAEALRSREGMYASPLDSSDYEEIIEMSSEDAALRRAEVRLLLRRACAVLTRRQRTILYLRYFEELSQQEIANQLGVTQMQVSRLLRGILGTLRNELAATQRRAAA